MILGLDYLGGCKFQKELLKAHPQGWCAGFFLNTFGNAKPTIEAAAKSEKFSEIVAHLAPFDSTHRYPIPSLMPQLKKDARWLQQMAIKYPGVKFYLSPFCEHNHPLNKISAVFGALEAETPNCVMLNSIWKGAVVPGTVTEIHLPNSKPVKPPKGPYTVSFDGFGGDGSGDMPDTDFQAIAARYPEALQVRGWNFRFNGKFGHKDTAPVNKRSHWPTIQYIKAQAASMQPREGIKSWPNTALLKPLADDHGEDAPTKDNKLMVILKKQAQLIKVYDSKGTQIDVLRRFPGDHTGTPKGARYYSSKYAFQVADLAKKNTGSRLIRVDDMPLTDGYLRSGLFR